MHRARIFATILPALVIVVITPMLFRTLSAFANESAPSAAMLDIATVPDDVMYQTAINLPIVIGQPGSEKYSADNRAFELEVLRLINEQRALINLPLLTEHRALTQAARRHAEDM